MYFDKVVDAIEKRAANSIQTDTKDYLDDQGLLVCGNCNTRKQCVVDLFGKKRTPFCLCKCMKEKLESEGRELERQKFIQKIKDLRQMGFPDEEMMNLTFAKDDKANPNLSYAAQKYVEHFPKMMKDGKGLLLFGDVGGGKTFMSACIANALIDQGHPCMVTNFARLINTLSGMYEGKQKYIDGLNKFDLLVIDDLAAERDTEYMNETVQNIIDNRYRCKKPLIVTTNLTAEELQNPIDIKKKRVYSRLAEMCIPVRVNGIDRRKKKRSENFKEYQDLLGLGKTL